MDSSNVPSVPMQRIYEESHQPLKPWIQQPQIYHQPSYIMPADQQVFGMYGAQPQFGQYSRITQNPGWSALQGLQEGSHQLTNTLSNTMATISNFVQLVDTAVYSAWSSLTSLLALISQLSNFHNQYIQGGLMAAKLLLSKIIRTLFAYSPGASIHGRRIAAIILGASLALAFLIKKALGDIMKIDFGSLPTNTVITSAKYSFEPQNNSQIALFQGQKIRIAAEDKSNIGKYIWLKGWTDNGQVGYIPANYVDLT